MSSAGRAIRALRSLIFPRLAAIVFPRSAAIVVVALVPLLLATVAIATPEQAKLTASDGAAADEFGRSVSVSGDTAVLGAPFDDDNGSASGSAYVFVRIGSNWSQQAKLTPSDGVANGLFGYSVSLSGDIAVVGVPQDDDNGFYSGSAYVFVRSGSNWSQQAKLTPSDGAALEQFGWSVSLSGETAVVGAYNDDDNGSGSGSAYVFVRGGTTWTEQAKLTASDGATYDNFGGSVSADGDTAVVGANGDDDNGTDSGSAYVFVRSGTTWNEQAKLTPSSPYDYFGRSVSLNGDTVVVGAPQDSDVGLYSGSAYVFVRSGSNWSQQAKLTAGDGAAYDQLGSSISVSGDSMIVGSFADDDNGSGSGSAYVFGRSGTTWTQQAKLTASDGAAMDWFGWSVSLSGDTAVVGAYSDDDNGTNSGSSYVYTLVDNDGDAILDVNDTCPNDAEDFDGFEDTDGCPDPDNDGDAILDVNDTCPNDAEDFDGFEDTDGCPDPDNDSDGILDVSDNCPNHSNPGQEDEDGDAVGDACEDNDGDGIVDVDDACPLLIGVPEEDGCPPPGRPLAVGGVAGLLEPDTASNAFTARRDGDGLGYVAALAGVGATLVAGAWYVRRRWQTIRAAGRGNEH